MSGQINLSDSSVQVIGYWTKGEIQNYKITKKKIQLNNDQIVKNDSVVYDVEIQIMDSTENSYTMQWHYKNYRLVADSSLDFPLLTDGFKVVYRTDEYGVFEGVLNGEEIKEFFDNMTRLIVRNLQDKNSLGEEEAEKIYAVTSSLYSTKEAIESMLIQEIQQYHMFHGMAIKKGEPVADEIELPNALGSELLTANAYFGLEEIYSDETYLMKSVQSTPREQLIKALRQYLNRMSESMDTTMNFDAIAGMEFINETTTYSEIHDSGWVIYSLLNKTIVSDNITVIQEYIIEIQ